MEDAEYKIKKADLEAQKDVAQGSFDGVRVGELEKALKDLEVAKASYERAAEGSSTTSLSQESQIKALEGDEKNIPGLSGKDEEINKVKLGTSKKIEKLKTIPTEPQNQQNAEVAPGSVSKEALEKANDELKRIPDVRVYDAELEKPIIKRYLEQGNENGFSAEEKEILSKYDDDTRNVLKATKIWFNGDGKTSHMIVKDLGNPGNVIRKAEEKLVESVERIIANNDKQLIKEKVIGYLIGGDRTFSPETLKVLVKAYEVVADEPIMVAVDNLGNGKTDWRENFEGYVKKVKQSIEAAESLKSKIEQ